MKIQIKSLHWESMGNPIDKGLHIYSKVTDLNNAKNKYIENGKTEEEVRTKLNMMRISWDIFGLENEQSSSE